VGDLPGMWGRTRPPNPSKLAGECYIRGQLPPSQQLSRWGRRALAVAR